MRHFGINSGCKNVAEGGSRPISNSPGIFSGKIPTFRGVSIQKSQNRPKSAIFSDFDWKKLKTTNISRYNTYPSLEGVIRTKHSGSLIKIVRAVFEKN